MERSSETARSGRAVWVAALLALGCRSHTGPAAEGVVERRVRPSATNPVITGLDSDESDPGCMAAVRAEVIEGVHRSPYVNVDSANSIDGRLGALSVRPPRPGTMASPMSATRSRPLPPTGWRWDSRRSDRSRPSRPARHPSAGRTC